MKLVIKLLQKQEPNRNLKTVRADAILRTAAAQSSVAIDASFERGKQRIRARLDDVAGVGEIGRFIGHSRFPGQS